MRKAAAEDGRERQHEPGVGAHQQPHDVGHDEAHEADQAGQGHRSGRDQRGQAEQDGPLAPHVHAEVLRRVVAQQQAVQRACPGHDEHACPTRMMGRPTTRLCQSAPRQAAEQVEEDLAQLRAGEVHGHGQAGRQHGAHRVARQQQRGERGAAAAAGDLVDDEHGRQGAHEGQDVDEAQAQHGDLHGDEHADGRPERRATGRAQHVGVGQRVAQQALEGDAGHGQAEAHDQGREHARQAQLHDDGLRRLRPGLGHGPAQQVAGQDGDGVSGRDGDGAQGDARHDRDHQHDQADQAQHHRATAQLLEAAGPGDDLAASQVRGGHRLSRPRRARARPGSPASSSSGWMARAREASPCARRGPGRVTGTSSTGRMSPLTTAVMSPQPGRAATSAGQTP